MKKDKPPHLTEARQILKSLGMPPPQQNDRSGFALLALLNLPPEADWSKAEAPLIGVPAMITWIGENYGKEFAPLTREAVRRRTLNPFVEAGIALFNPDLSIRANNSTYCVFQIEPTTLELLRTYGTAAWPECLEAYLAAKP